MWARVALTLLSSALWLQPPAVLPQPSRSGPDGPPRPYGFQPAPGSNPPHTARALVRAQDRALLHGPFPRNGLARGVSDGTLLLSEQAPVRELALTRIRAAGATVVRVPVDWRDIAPPAPPAGFNASDPANPAYNFARVDAAVDSAVAADLEPLLVVSHAPAFAEAPHRWPFAYPGSWAPSPAALGAFASALARRYDGSFSDPLTPTAVLPRVRLLQAWNEPNLPRYLEPQWIVQGRRWSAFSPLLYRQMLNAFYAGVKSVEPSDTVVAAGIAPTGDPEGVGRMAPIPFLRDMLCLQPLLRVAPVAHLAQPPSHTPSLSRPAHSPSFSRLAHPQRFTRSDCPQPPRFDVLAFHPLSVADPDIPAASAVDVSISDAAKIVSLLGEAQRRRTVLPAARKPIWVTELNWQSAPQSPTGVPPRLQAPWVSRALHRLWVAGVQLVDWQFLIDPYPALHLTNPNGTSVELSRPAGLYLPGVLNGRSEPARARPKLFLRGFAFPFDPLRVDRRHVRVWALLDRPTQPVQLQRRLPTGRWRTIAHLHSNRYGVLNALLPLAGPVSLRLSSAGLLSASASLGRGRGSSRARPGR